MAAPAKCSLAKHQQQFPSDGSFEDAEVAAAGPPEGSNCAKDQDQTGVLSCSTFIFPFFIDGRRVTTEVVFRPVTKAITGPPWNNRAGKNLGIAAQLKRKAA